MTIQNQRTISVGLGEWGFRNLPMRRHFEIARQFDCKWLEFGIGGDQVGRLPEFPDAGQIAEYRALNEEFGIETPFCCIENDFTLAESSAHEEVLDKCRRQLVAAAECGATHVRLFAGFTPAAEITPEIWSRMISAFEIMDSQCAGLGLTIAIETHGGIRFNDDGSATHINSVTTDPDCLRRLMEELPPRVGFNFDPGNIKAVRPDDPDCCLSILNERINYCHMKDWSRQGDGWVAVAIGDDALDYAPLFERMSFSGVYLIEYEPLHDCEDGIRRSLDYLERIAAGQDNLSFQR